MTSAAQIHRQLIHTIDISYLIYVRSFTYSPSNAPSYTYIFQLADGGLPESFVVDEEGSTCNLTRPGFFVCTSISNPTTLCCAIANLNK